MTKKATKSVESIIHELEVILRECRNDCDPVLQVNADAIVVEYNSRYNNAKFFDRICGLEDIK